jgi:hypothetical protein
MQSDKPSVEISQDELDYIRQLFPRAAKELEELAGSATLDVPESASNLLNTLLLADNLRLQADVGDYTLIFEPRTEYSPEDGTRRFHLGYPSIVEKNDHLRSHRVHKISKDIRLSENGRMLPRIHVDNISETGMSLISEAPIPNLVPGKTVLSLQLQFPHERWVPCKATVVRTSRRDRRPRLALRFIRTPRRTHELLREYIYHHSPDLVPRTAGEKGAPVE